jgi:hypothetical protein
MVDGSDVGRGDGRPAGSCEGRVEMVIDIKQVHAKAVQARKRKPARARFLAAVEEAEADVQAFERLVMDAEQAILHSLIFVSWDLRRGNRG